MNSLSINSEVGRRGLVSAPMPREAFGESSL